MELIKKTLKPMIYIFGAIVFSLALLFAALTENDLGIPSHSAYIEWTIKLIFIVSCSVFLAFKEKAFLKTLTERNTFSIYLVIGLTVALSACLMNFRTPNHNAGFRVNAGVFFGILTTVVSEEIYYRLFATAFFSQNNIVPLKNVIIMITVFGLSHAVNCYENMIDGLLTVANALCFGAFLTAVFLKTKNLLLAIVIHLFVNTFATVFTVNSNQTPTFGATLQIVFYAVSCLLSIISAVVILKKLLWHRCTKKQRNIE